MANNRKAVRVFRVMRGRKKAKTKVLPARVDVELHRRLKSLIGKTGTTIQRFVTDAVVAKLNESGVDASSVGPLRDLSPEDRALVEWIAGVLRDRPDNTLLRDVIHAQRAVLLVVAESD
jgi:hypothetical protein